MMMMMMMMMINKQEQLNKQRGSKSLTGPPLPLRTPTFFVTSVMLYVSNFITIESSFHLLYHILT